MFILDRYVSLSTLRFYNASIKERFPHVYKEWHQVPFRSNVRSHGEKDWTKRIWCWMVGHTHSCHMSLSISTIEEQLQKLSCGQQTSKNDAISIISTPFAFSFLQRLTEHNMSVSSYIFTTLIKPLHYLFCHLFLNLSFFSIAFLPIGSEEKREKASRSINISQLGFGEWLFISKWIGFWFEKMKMWCQNVKSRLQNLLNERYPLTQTFGSVHDSLTNIIPIQ